ncbi:ATP-binding protein [Vibrio salinus]|uniref:ATP-binding protein n=1 Tax=Vibrio salinus TaxID=2899784 RepID=UPI001E648DEF|nr:sensor histidine kinase [Vibrio salinus]MCE0495539.1 sensor histidine kinase [Vibrio salinus]
MLNSVSPVFNQLHRNLSFRQRVWLLLFIAVISQLLLIAGYFQHIITNALDHQVSTRAVVQAREIASDPQLIEQIEKRNIAGIRQQIKRLQKISDASFIVVGDKNGIRLAHPIASRVGHPMIGGDNDKALKQGLHYYSIRKGSLGFAIRGKSPVFSHDGKIIGIVSVGYLLETVSNWLILYSHPFFFALLFVLTCSSVGAWFFSRHIKSQMYGMEPKEIALSLRVQNSVFSAVYEGIIAVNQEGCILSANQRALKILGIARHADNLQGQHINQFITPPNFFIGLSVNGETDTSERFHQEITCNGETLIASRVQIQKNDSQTGWVISFLPRNDRNLLTTQLEQVQHQTDTLRVLSHEYANKLSTVSGLIQIGAYDQALNAIRKETETHQRLIDFISTTFRSRVVAGLLLGKYSRAKELGITLSFDPYCQLHRVPSQLTEEELAAILGNLLDNAYEATLKNPDSNKHVSLLLTDDNENEMVIEVTDNGIGIPQKISESLFDKGISSKKQPGHGIGLYLVHQYVNRIGGTILIDQAEPAGTIFSLFLPNKGLNNGNL